MTAIPDELNIGTVTEALDEHGRPLTVDLIPRTEKLISQVWFFIFFSFYFYQDEFNATFATFSNSKSFVYCH